MPHTAHHGEQLSASKLKLLRKIFPNQGFGASPQRECRAELFGAMAGARARARQRVLGARAQAKSQSHREGDIICVMLWKFRDGGGGDGLSGRVVPGLMPSK